MVPNVEFIAVVVFTTIVTYLTRFPGLLFGRTIHVSPRLEQGLRNIPIGIFVAMIAPSILHNSHLNGQMNWPFISATAVSLITAWSTKKPLLTMLSGVIFLAGMRMFL